jgi:chromosome segregation ATPase
VRRRTAEEEASEAERRADQAERRARAADKRLADATAAVQAQRDLLDRAQALHDAGLDEGALATLAGVFGQVAQTAGISPSEAVARFLKAAAAFEGIAAFERQVAEAEARANKAEADAQQRERSAKVRKVAVDWAEWFVRRGITVEAVKAWKSVAEKLGLTAENLARGLADALERFGSLEAACQVKARERDSLDREIEQRRAGIAKLTQERDRISAALEAVAEEGAGRVADAEGQAIASIEAVRDTALAALRATMERYAELTKEAAALEPAVRFAQALLNPHELLWLDVTPEQWAGLLRQFARYLASRGDPEAPPPEQVSKQLKDRMSWPALYGQPRLGELVGWLIAGLHRPIRDMAQPTDVARRYLGDGRG